ncbi:MAG: hypothetical protein AAF412_11945 [Pseudomonadota bacterium]
MAIIFDCSKKPWSTSFKAATEMGVSLTKDPTMGTLEVDTSPSTLDPLADFILSVTKETLINTGIEEGFLFQDDGYKDRFR